MAYHPYKDRYHEYLKSKKWKLFRKKVLARADYRCEGCGQFNLTLQVHHITYDRIGMELMTDCVALCSKCHKRIHGLDEKSEWHLYMKGKASRPKLSVWEKIKRGFGFE